MCLLSEVRGNGGLLKQTFLCVSALVLVQVLTDKPGICYGFRSAVAPCCVGMFAQKYIIIIDSH